MKGKSSYCGQDTRGISKMILKGGNTTCGELPRSQSGVGLLNIPHTITLQTPVLLVSSGQAPFAFPSSVHIHIASVLVAKNKLGSDQEQGHKAKGWHGSWREHTSDRTYHKSWLHFSRGKPECWHCSGKPLDRLSYGISLHSSYLGPGYEKWLFPVEFGLFPSVKDHKPQGCWENK